MAGQGRDDSQLDDLLLPGAGAPPSQDDVARLPGGDAPAPPVAGPPLPSALDEHVALLTGQAPPGPPISAVGSWQDLMTAPLGPPPSMGGGGSYTVDPERAPQAIADLRHAAEVLKDEVYRAEELANFPPPGLDAVSVEAVRVISQAAIGEQGSLRAALQGAADEFERQADKLEVDLKAYLQVEELNIPAPTPMEQL